MAIDVTWPTPTNPIGTIHVEKADTTLVEIGPPERRKLDVNWLRGEVSSLWASDDGAPYSKPFIHYAETIISGITYCRKIIFLAPYTIEFEDGQYSVRLEGADHNVDDVTVPNQVRIVTNLSAGLIRDPAVDQSNVQAAMTAQGYNSTRASNLDALDANVSSRAAPGNEMALTPAERSTTVTEIIAAAQTSGVLTTNQAQELLEIWNLLGLDPAGPLVTTSASRMAPGIMQQITRASGIVTVKRI